MADRATARPTPADSPLRAPAPAARAHRRQALQIPPLGGTRPESGDHGAAERLAAPGALPSRGAHGRDARGAARMGDRALAGAPASAIARGHPGGGARGPPGVTGPDER